MKRKYKHKPYSSKGPHLVGKLHKYAKIRATRRAKAETEARSLARVRAQAKRNGYFLPAGIKSSSAAREWLADMLRQERDPSALAGAFGARWLPGRWKIHVDDSDGKSLTQEELDTIAEGWDRDEAAAEKLERQQKQLEQEIKWREQEAGLLLLRSKKLRGLGIAPGNQWTLWDSAKAAGIGFALAFAGAWLLGKLMGVSSRGGTAPSPSAAP